MSFQRLLLEHAPVHYVAFDYASNGVAEDFVTENLSAPTANMVYGVSLRTGDYAARMTEPFVFSGNVTAHDSVASIVGMPDDGSVSILQFSNLTLSLQSTGGSCTMTIGASTSPAFDPGWSLVLKTGSTWTIVPLSDAVLDGIYVQQVALLPTLSAQDTVDLSSAAQFGYISRPVVGDSMQLSESGINTIVADWHIVSV